MRSASRAAESSAFRRLTPPAEDGAALAIAVAKPLERGVLEGMTRVSARA